MMSIPKIIGVMSCGGRAVSPGFQCAGSGENELRSP